MATNGNNLEPAFEALLKAHVQQHSAPMAAACAQFDPDTANAYLERMLTPTALATYEDHLAGCAVCRRQLAQLAQLMPVPAPVVSTLSEAESLSLRDRFSSWWTTWRMGALVGFGAVAATALLLVVLVSRSSQREAMVALSRSEEVAKSPAAAPAASGLPAAATNADRPSETVAKNAPSASPATVAKGSAPVVTSPLPLAADKAMVDAVAPPPPPKGEAPVSQGQQAQSVRQDDVLKQVPAPEQLARPQTQLRNVQLPLKGPADVQSERGERARVEPATPAPGAAPSRPQEKAVEKEKKAEGFAAATTREADSTGKKSAEADESRRDAIPKGRIAPMKPTAPARRTVGNKTFHLQNGFWTDLAYDASANLSVIRLQTDSDAYQQTLQSQPALKPYFEIAPVVVAWQGKVYRVEKK